MNRFVILFILVIFLSAITILQGQGFGWRLVNSKIQREFPGVPRLTTSDLAAWLSDPAREKPVLLDVRTAPEYEVSHLRGAQRIDPDASPSSVSFPKDGPIVTYCSVGYRSARLAQKLREAGYQKVANLEGSIFAWANESRPLVHDGRPTDKVHPYNGVWGMLLDKQHRAAPGTK